MCIICYKPLNVAFPEERILKNCFDNNNDGAGFMYVYENKVHIRKGFETFKAFYNALNNARKITGDGVPYVMHFRIATQGYKKEFTHPFPLSSNMENLKRLKTNCNIGIAHNGIISLTSDGSPNYSDTMKFINEYLSLIIQSFDYYKNKRTLKLIEKLIGNSRLAILDKSGFCQLLGDGWIEDKKCFYSNNTYSYKKQSYYPIYDYNNLYEVKSDKKIGFKYWNKYDEYARHYNRNTKQYDFNFCNCPVACDGDYTYCKACKNYAYCAYSPYSDY